MVAEEGICWRVKDLVGKSPTGCVEKESVVIGYAMRRCVIKQKGGEEEQQMREGDYLSTLRGR